MKKIRTSKEHQSAICSGHVTEWHDGKKHRSIETPRWPTLEKGIRWRTGEVVDPVTGQKRHGHIATLVEDGVEHEVSVPDEPRARQQCLARLRRGHADRAEKSAKE